MSALSPTVISLAFQLCGIDATAASADVAKQYLEEVTKLVDLSQSSRRICHAYSETEKIEIHQWITFSSNKIDSSVLAKFDKMLTKKSYLVGHRFTVADVLVFAAIHDQKATDTALSHCNVARWLDHTQHMVKSAVVPVLPVKHTVFSFSVPEDTGNAKSQEVKKDETQKVESNAKADGSNKKDEKKEKPAKAESKGEEKGILPPSAPTAAGESKSDSPASAEGLDPSKLEIRVGSIVKCWNHPESVKLLCEEIDLGEGSTRTIASGLRAFYTAEEMQGKKVLVLANLKERPMVGFKSQVSNSVIFYCLLISNVYSIREWFYVLSEKIIRM
jgi:aminoacyl tRNA synthase complex-interacting multifunctional protein 1